MLAAASTLAMPLTSRAQEFPTLKPIRLVIPFAVGGSSDVVGRIIAQKLAEILQQTVVVDNRAGAGGIIGSDVVAKSPADGHTLLLVEALHVINPIFTRRMPFDAVNDFLPVALNDLLSGPINLLVASIATVSAFVKSGKLRMLATSAPTRHPD